GSAVSAWRIVERDQRLGDLARIDPIRAVLDRRANLGDSLRVDRGSAVALGAPEEALHGLGQCDAIAGGPPGGVLRGLRAVAAASSGRLDLARRVAPRVDFRTVAN